MDEAEAQPVAFVPFEIVEERPIEIAAHIGSINDGAVDSGESGGDELLAQLIGRIRETAFGDVDRQAVGLEFEQRLIDRVGPIFPAEVGLDLVRILAEAVVDDVAVVVIQPDEVLVVSDAIEEERIPSPAGERLEEMVDERRAGHLECDLVLGDADLRSWESLLDRLVGEPVRADEMMERAEIEKRILLLRRPGAFEVGVSGYHVGLVEGDPECYLAAELFGDLRGVAFEVSWKICRGGAAFFGEPEGERPVPEGDEGFDVPRAECGDDRTVVFDLFLIEDAFARLDTRPLDREAIGAQVERLHNVEIFFVARIVFAGGTGEIVFRISGLQAETFLPSWYVTEY